MRKPSKTGKTSVLAALVVLLWALAAPRTGANFSKGGFVCACVSTTTWTSGTDPTATWYGSGYTTTGSVADLSAAANAGTDARALIQALPIPAAGTYKLSLRARFSSPNQGVYWHVLGVMQGRTLTLTNGGIPQTITQAGVKSLLKVAPPGNNATGAWIAYSNTFTLSPADAAAYRYLVVALVSSRLSAQVAQFDDVYTDVPAVTTDAAAGVTAQWYSSATAITALSQVNWSSPIKTTKEEQINWINTGAAPFVVGVPADRFAVRCTGTITIPSSGAWTLSLGADDGTSLVFNNATVLAADGQHSFATRNVTVNVSAGRYPFEMKFFENTGSQGCVLSWRGPGMAAAEVIPSSAFRSQLRVTRWRPVSADE